MTKQQQEELSKLELAYLDEVRANNPEGQLRQMEVIFFWVKKQVTEARALIIAQMPYDPNRVVALDITAKQKGDFTFLQMAMLKAAFKKYPDKEMMVEVEKKMREWVDLQITAECNLLVKPQMKIVRDNEKK
jgi:hypothetical protein